MNKEENGNKEDMLSQNLINIENQESDEQTEKGSETTTKGTFSSNSSWWSRLSRQQKLAVSGIAASSLGILILIIISLSRNLASSLTFDLPKQFVKSSLTQEEIVDYLTHRGYCESNVNKTKETEDCLKTKAGKFWIELKEIYEKYQNDKDVTLNIDMLVATLSYRRDDTSLYNSADEISILANAMVEEYEEEEIDPETQEKKTVTKYRLNMNQYKEFIIGTGEGGSDFGTPGSGKIDSSKQELFDWIVPLAKELQKATGILPSVTIGQKIQESGWNIRDDYLAQKCYNYFGMKVGESSWKGPYVFTNTPEYVNGNKIQIKDAFRCYSNQVEGFNGRGTWFWSYSRYRNFLLYNFEKDWKNAVIAVKAAGYASDPNYVSSVTKIINSYELYQYDNDLNYQWDGTFPDYARYDPFSGQKIDQSSKDNSSIATEIYISGGGYIEKYRSDLLKGYKDSEILKRKVNIYEDILELSQLTDEGNKSGDSNYNFSMYSCSSPPLKLQSGKKYLITSPYGLRVKPIAEISDSFHNGIDIGGYSTGSEVYAVAQGTVVEASTQLEGGNFIRIGHDLDNDGKYDNYTGYYHLSKYAVKTGDKVTCGQVIGYVGQSGMATGPHLHFGLQDQNEKFIDPTSLLDSLVTKTSIFDKTVAPDGSYPGYYNQGLYSHVSYCNASQGTIKSSGCALASFATAVANLTNKEVDIGALANFVCTQTNYRVPGSGTAIAFWENDVVASKYGVKITRLSKSEINFDNMYSILQSGKKLTASIKCCGKFKSSAGSHLIELNSAENGKILVYDVGNRSNVGWYDRNDIITNVINKIYSGMWYIENR